MMFQDSLLLPPFYVNWDVLEQATRDENTAVTATVTPRERLHDKMKDERKMRSENKRSPYTHMSVCRIFSHENDQPYVFIRFICASSIWASRIAINPFASWIVRTSTKMRKFQSNRAIGTFCFHSHSFILLTGQCEKFHQIVTSRGRIKVCECAYEKGGKLMNNTIKAPLSNVLWWVQIDAFS